MNLQASVNKTMSNVLNEIKKVNEEIDPRKEGLLKNLNKIILYPINEIIVSENIRNHLDKNSEDFIKLVESVKQNGILQSIIVEYREKGASFELVCVAGHRRLEAAKEVGLEKISCLIQLYKEDSERTRIALAENLIREGLHVLDIAQGFQDLINVGWYEDKIAQYYERDIKTIRRYLNIAKWPDDIKELVYANKDVFNYTTIMKKYATRLIITQEQQDELRKEILKQINGETKQKENNTNEHIIKELKEKISLKVELKENDSKGKLSISFNNEEEKNKLLKIFGLTLV